MPMPPLPPPRLNTLAPAPRPPKPLDKISIADLPVDEIIKRLSPQAKAALWIRAYCKARPGCLPSTTVIAAFVRVSQSTAKRALREPRK